MLLVRIDGREMETTPALLARLVFDGKADQHSPARLADRTLEQPLETSLPAPYGEALTDELHHRLQKMGSLDSSAIDPQELYAQVERLCRWRWTNPTLAARFFWSAGWLNELAGRSKSALDFYDAFLLMPCRESHLRLLALNNRGVLRLGQGRQDGIVDLVQAALGDCGLRMAEGGLKKASDADSQSGGLPVACFNLLNLINVSFRAADLLRTVDEELMNFFGRLPEDLRVWWLEGGPVVGSQYSVAGQEKSRTDNRLPTTDYRLPILRDPTYRRLNTLMARLATQAHGLMTDSCPPVDRSPSLFRQLWLWDCRSEEESASRGEPGRRSVGSSTAVFCACGVAAGLLLADDIPASLAGPDDPRTRVEQAAQEELAVIEGQLTSGQYELAQTRLQVQRKVLASFNGHGAPAALLTRVDALIERAAQLQTQDRQLELQRVCAGWVAELEQFCTLTDLDQAQTTLEDLQRRWRQLKARWTPPESGALVHLFDDLAARGRQHIHELLQIRLPASPWAQVREGLARAVACDPVLWFLVAPWFGLGGKDGGLGEAPEANPPSATRHPPFTVDDAGWLLELAFQKIGGETGRCLTLWECIEKTLTPVLAGSNGALLAGVRGLARKCLDCWPAGGPQEPLRVDPRHPVNRFLETCDKVLRLAQAWQELNAQPSRYEEAAQLFARLLDEGCGTPDHLRGAVTGFYLAQFRGQDPPSLQREVLAGLEDWVRRRRPEEIAQTRRPEVREEMERIRQGIMNYQL